jgi:hypothetical protein
MSDIFIPAWPHDLSIADLLRLADLKGDISLDLQASGEDNDFNLINYKVWPELLQKFPAEPGLSRVVYCDVFALNWLKKLIEWKSLLPYSGHIEHIFVHAVSPIVPQKKFFLCCYTLPTGQVQSAFRINLLHGE